MTPGKEWNESQSHTLESQRYKNMSEELGRERTVIFKPDVNKISCCPQGNPHKTGEATDHQNWNWLNWNWLTKVIEGNVGFRTSVHLMLEPVPTQTLTTTPHPSQALWGHQVGNYPALSIVPDMELVLNKHFSWMKEKNESMNQ